MIYSTVSLTSSTCHKILILSTPENQPVKILQATSYSQKKNMMVNGQFMEIHLYSALQQTCTGELALSVIICQQNQRVLQHTNKLLLCVSKFVTQGFIKVFNTKASGHNCNISNSLKNTLQLLRQHHYDIKYIDEALFKAGKFA